MKLQILASALLLVMAMPANSQALTVTASETIEDPQPFEILARDLTRTRLDDQGFFSVETNDATIVSQNLVDSDFGVTNNNDVTFRHDLTWLSPPAGNFLSASLRILAWANIGGDDILFADNINLGALSNGTILSGLFSSTTFNLNPVILNAVFANGYLDIYINKNQNALIGNGFNVFSVYSSRLQVSYEAVPEPTSMLLLGSGMIGLLAKRRRAKA